MITITNYEIGMTIKSFDFPNDESSFIVGKITAVDDENGDYIYCDTISQTFRGEVLPFPVVGHDSKPTYGYAQKSFRTIKQGIYMFDDVFQRVVVLG